MKKGQLLQGAEPHHHTIEYSRTDIVRRFANKKEHSQSWCLELEQLCTAGFTPVRFALSARAHASTRRAITNSPAHDSL
jgi:hypothetical protein